MDTAARPRVGVVKLASCDGCQLTLLDLEDELLPILGRFDVVEFAEARTTRSDGPYDVLFVEGSVSTPEQADEIVALRAGTRTLVTIGACATAGGIQALRNWRPTSRRGVPASTPAPSTISSLATATPDRRSRRRSTPSCAAARSRPHSSANCSSRSDRSPAAVPRRSRCASSASARGNVLRRSSPTASPASVLSRGPAAARCARPTAAAATAASARVSRPTSPACADSSRSIARHAEVDRLFAGFTGWAPPFRESAHAGR